MLQRLDRDCHVHSQSEVRTLRQLKLTTILRTFCLPLEPLSGSAVKNPFSSCHCHLLSHKLICLVFCKELRLTPAFWTLFLCLVIWHLFMCTCYFFVLRVLVVLASKILKADVRIRQSLPAKQLGAKDWLVLLCAVLTVLRSLEN